MILLLEIQYLMGWCGPFPQGCAPENGRTKTGTHPSARRPCIAAGARKGRPSAVVEKGRAAHLVLFAEGALLAAGAMI